MQKSIKSSASIIVEGDLENIEKTYKMSIKENNLIFTLDRSLSIYITNLSEEFSAVQKEGMKEP